jgi:phosphoglycolate phosphatase-like HAD superfamily hydrolase
MIRLVLFDIDGTLIQSGGAGEKAFAHVCASQFGVPNGTQHLSFAGRTDPAIIREFFQQHDIKPSAENFRRFLDAYVFFLDHLLAKLDGRVLPGVRDLIREWCALPQPPVMGLLTGNIRLGARLKLGHYQLWEEFQTGAFGDDHEDRNHVATVARERGSRLLGNKLRGEEILVIGDTPLDIACARAIDAKVLAVATGRFGVEELRPHQPDWAVETLEAVSVRELSR